MKPSMAHLADYFERVPDQLRKGKWIVWLFFVAATIFFFFGTKQTKFDMTIEAWFADNDPTLVALDQYHAEFGSEDNIYIAYKPKNGNVFSTRSLEVIRGIQNDLLQYRYNQEKDANSPLNHIVRIRSLINAPILQADGDVLISRHLVGQSIPTSKDELAEIRRTAESQKMFPKYYFSEDCQYGGIIIETDFGAIPLDDESANLSIGGKDLDFDNLSMSFDDQAPEERIRFKKTDMADYLTLMNKVKEVLNKPEYAKHMDYYPVGNAASTEYNLEKIQEMGMLNLLTIAIMVVLLWYLFRSLSAVIWPLAVVVLSIIWTIGITGYIGLTVTPFLMLTIMLILTIGMADTIHILSGYIFYRNRGNEHRATLRAVFKKIIIACVLTALTNIAGILALNITPIIPIRIFALMSAVGIILCLFFTIYLVPLMLDIWAPAKADPKKHSRSVFAKYIPDFSRYLEKILTNVLPTVEKRPYVYIMVFAVIFGVCIYGGTKVKVDTNPIGDFPEDSPFRKSVQIIDQKLTGAQNMEIYLDLQKAYAFQDPFVLETMDRLQNRIQTKYRDLVVRTSSLVDTVKDSYQKLNEGREDMYIIPSDKKVLSETLFLFNNANSDDRSRLVSDDYRKSHISINLYNAGSSEYTKTFDSMRKDIDEAVSTLKQKYPDTRVDVTGLFALMMQGAHYVTMGELQSFGLALLIISVVLLFVFRSYKAGVIAIIPNLIPSVLAFGLMGLLGIPMDFFTMMLAPIIIGIALDDTVHFLTLYRSDVLVHGDIKKALQHNLVEVGQAITFTSLVLGLGFGIMAISSIPSTSNVGKFGSLAVFSGLLCDLFLLPALIVFFKFRFQRSPLIRFGFAGRFFKRNKIIWQHLSNRVK